MAQWLSPASGVGGLTQRAEDDGPARARDGDAARHVERALSVPGREERVERLDVCGADVGERCAGLGGEDPPDARADRPWQGPERVEVDALTAGTGGQVGSGPDGQALEVVGVLAQQVGTAGEGGAEAGSEVGLQGREEPAGADPAERVVAVVRVVPRLDAVGRTGGQGRGPRQAE